MMQPLEKANISATAEMAATEILEGIFLVMRTIRDEMRSHQVPSLSVPQFRTLNFIHLHPHSSLSEVAEHIGLTLPTMSKLIDTLVERELIIRQAHPRDRRRMALALTPAGSAILHRAQAKARGALASRLVSLRDEERQIIIEAMRILRPIFGAVGIPKAPETQEV